jgi:stalled ribosome alternative rescue factor ArfA
LPGERRGNIDVGLVKEKKRHLEGDFGGGSDEQKKKKVRDEKEAIIDDDLFQSRREKLG